MIAAIVVLGLGLTLALGIFQHQRREACQVRNDQITAQNQAQDHSRAFLSDVADAMKADGLKTTPAALDRYINQIKEQDRLSPIDCG
jgi:hypothetical protein